MSMLVAAGVSAALSASWRMLRTRLGRRLPDARWAVIAAPY
ncbi:hypothetical protein [Xanthomonas albilineans]|nr:hypothetical protein [Xanthomonas albilineans]